MQRRPQAEERERKVQAGGNVRKGADRTVTVRGMMHEKRRETEIKCKGKAKGVIPVTSAVQRYHPLLLFSWRASYIIVFAKGKVKDFFSLLGLDLLFQHCLCGRELLLGMCCQLQHRVGGQQLAADARTHLSNAGSLSGTTT